MNTKIPTAPESICAEILDDARRRRECLLRQTEEQAKELLKQAENEAQKAREERLEAARTQAARRKESLLMAVMVEETRLRASKTEQLLDSIYVEAAQRLVARRHFDYRESLLTLAAEAISHMSGETFVLKVSAADQANLIAGLAQDITQRVGRPNFKITVLVEPMNGEAGLTIEDGEGRQVWDNHLQVRLRRLWPELRRQIAIQTLLVTPDSRMAAEAANSRSAASRELVGPANETNGLFTPAPPRLLTDAGSGP